MRIKKGDKVLVIAGKSKGAEGTISRVIPAKNAVLIEGLNLVKRHRRPTAQSRKGQIIDKPMPIDASNVMLLDPKSGKRSRIRITRDKEGNRVRVSVKSCQELK